MPSYFGQSDPVRVTPFAKPDVTVATAWTTANSPITLFTVTGLVLARFYGYVTGAISSTANTGTLALGIAGATTAFLPTTTANGTNFVANVVWVDASATLLSEPLPITSGWNLINGSNVILTVATNNMTAGGMTLVCEWIARSANASVV